MAISCSVLPVFKPVGRLLFFSAFSVVLFFSSSAFSADKKWLSEWEIVKETEGVSAECRTHVSKIEQCRLTGIVDSKIEPLLAINLDIKNLSAWMANVLHSERIESINPYEYFVYMQFNFPGARNRDSVSRSRVTRDPESSSVILAFETEQHSKRPLDTSFVRYPAFRGSWKFTPISDGTTRVTYEVIALPGAYVQEHLYYFYNIGALDNAFDTFENLREAVRSEPYLSSRFKWSELPTKTIR